MDVARGAKVLGTQMRTVETKLRLQIKNTLIMMNVTMIKPNPINTFKVEDSLRFTQMCTVV